MHKTLVPCYSIKLSKFKILFSISGAIFIPLSRFPYYIPQSMHPTQLNERCSVYGIIWSKFIIHLKIPSSKMGKIKKIKRVWMTEWLIVKLLKEINHFLYSYNESKVFPQFYNDKRCTLQYCTISEKKSEMCRENSYQNTFPHTSHCYTNVTLLT